MADPAAATTEYLSQLQAALQPPTKLASQLPAAEDVAFHRSIDKKVAAAYDQESSNLLDTIHRLTTWAGKSLKAQGKQRAESEDDHEEEQGHAPFARISDIVDNLLERADVAMDEYSAPPQSSMPSRGPLSHMSTSTSALPKVGKLPANILNAPMDPPQRTFTLQPDNSADTMWDRPLTMGKPNALPRSRSPSPPSSSAASTAIVRQGMYCAEGNPQLNPYYHEIFNQPLPTFIYQPPSEDELKAPPPIDPEVPQGTAGVPFTWIDTAKGVAALAAHLNEDRVKEIAIDLEAHAYRSYQGIACLMQLSTRWGDYVLDLVNDSVRTSIESFNTSFTHPDKIKILHGAEHDVLWLQRDCNLYLVNLFDTYHATNVLGFPGHSLAFLLSKYYDFEADKRYQLADWRLRPMPKEMVYYARSDTHSLIYVYQRLRGELLAAGGKQAMDEVFRRSKITAARRYAKEVWDEEGDSRDGWRSIWSRMGGLEAVGTWERREVAKMGRTERLFRRLHRWRDGVARVEDESPKYVLPTQALLNLASRAPMTKSEALAVFTPGTPAVRKRSGEVANIIKEEVLAWEQAQKELRELREKELQEGAAPIAQDGSDAEDVGISVDEPAPQPQPGSTPSIAMPPASPVVESLWSSPSGSSTSSPLRRKQSGLFGATLRRQEQAQAPSPLRDYVSSSLRSILGGQAQASSSAVAAEPAAQDVMVDEAPAAAPLPAAAANPPADTTPESEDDATEVQVKRKKDKTKKPKWSAEEKRKAREGREAAAAADGDAPAVKKRRTGADEAAEVKPFDYSSSTSLLDAPRAPSNGSAAADKRAKKQHKKKDEAAARAAGAASKGPERFADARQPRDRSTLGNGVGKSVTFS